MRTVKRNLWVPALALALTAGSQNLIAQTNLSTDCTTDTGAWTNWNGATVDFTNRPGFAHLVIPVQQLAGIQVTGGIPVTNYPPPWHFEIAIERPTDINTAIGVIFQSNGLQALWDSLFQPVPAAPSDPVVGEGGAVFPGSSGKSFTAQPDFSSVPKGKMFGKRFILYVGLVDDTHMRFGIRPDEGSTWAFAPDLNDGFSASNNPVSFQDMKLMVENRDGWFNYVGPLQGEPGAVGPANPVDVYVDYIHFTNTLTPSPVTAPPPGTPVRVAYYQFENDLTDFSGHDLNGTATGTINYETGEFGQMASFSGDTGFTVANNPLLNFGTNAFTASMWLRVDSTTDAQNVMSKTDGSANGFIIQTVPGSSASLVIKDGVGNTIAGPFSNLFPVGELHNVTIVYNAADNPAGKLYVDGSLSTAFSVSFNINNSSDLQIGFAATRPGSGARLALDDLRLYNYELSPTDIGRFIPPPPQLSTEFSSDTGSWVPYNGASSSLNVTPGYDTVMVGQQNFGGLDLPIGVLVTKYPPPWHFEVAFNRPTNINTAVGVLLDQGIQGLFHLVNNGAVAGFAGVGFDGGKGTANAPDFSSVDPTNMAGPRLVLYVGMVDDTHMRWGVRPGEYAPWAFAPDFDIGFSASNSPVSWPDMKLMIETRDAWFNYAAGVNGPTTNTTIAFDYIRFSTNLTPGPIASPDLGFVASSGNLGLWAPWRSATANFTNLPGYVDVHAPAQDFSGLQLTGGVPVSSYVPPWHFEFAINRPTNVNTAIGIIMQQGGYQCLFNSLFNGSSNFFQAATFNGSGKGTPPAPDFSGVPASAMTGPRLLIYFGQVDDTHVRWGVRANEDSPWYFAPDVDLGFSASAAPVSWPDLKLMIENRDSWFAQWGTVGPTNDIDVYMDYVKFFPDTLSPTPVTPNTIFTDNSGVWSAWSGASLNLSYLPGFGTLTQPVQSFGGLQLTTGGLPVTEYPPPWHLEVALERPTDVNTAIGFLLSQGIQGMFNSLSNGTINRFAAATWNGSGKGTPSPPDFSSVSASQMAGNRLIMYLGQVDDSHMRWGVRTDESSPWSFAPDSALNFNASDTPVSWPDVQLAIENRDAWYTQFGSGVTGSPVPVSLYLDYVKFMPTLTPSPVELPSRSTECNGDTGSWVNYNGSPINFTNMPGYANITVPTNGFDGWQIKIPVDTFPPPWHLEIALDRPTNVNTAIGLLMPSDGIQGLFQSLNGGNSNFFADAIFPGQKGTPNGPDFSGVPTSAMMGPRLDIYFGMQDDRTARWGVRSDDASPWSFAPDYDIGYSASASPVSFSVIRLMIENRDGWFSQWGTTAAGLPEDVYLDYIRFLPYDLSTTNNLGSLIVKSDATHVIVSWPKAEVSGQRLVRLQTAANVNGPWADAAVQDNPQIVIPATSATTFYRLVEDGVPNN